MRTRLVVTCLVIVALIVLAAVMGEGPIGPT
jgi:hypothetical protein